MDLVLYYIYSACAGVCVCVWYDIPYPSMSSLTNPCGSQTVSKPLQLKKLCNCLPNVSFKQAAVSQIRSRASCHDDHVSHHDTRIASFSTGPVHFQSKAIQAGITWCSNLVISLIRTLCCPVLPPLRWPCKIPQAGWPLRRSVGQTWFVVLGQCTVPDCTYSPNTPETNSLRPNANHCDAMPCVWKFDVSHLLK